MATKTIKQNNRHAPRLSECRTCGRKLPRHNHHGRCAECRAPDAVKRTMMHAAYNQRVAEQRRTRRAIA